MLELNPKPVSTTLEYHTYVRPDGRILTIPCYIYLDGRSNTYGCTSYVLSADGKLDLTDNGNSIAYGLGSVFGVQSDGRLIAQRRGDGHLTRFNLDLLSDPAFHWEGFHQLRSTIVFSAQTQSLVQSDDKILVTSVVSNQLHMARLNANGTLDTLFPTLVISSVDSLRGFDPAGRIVVIGPGLNVGSCSARVYSFTGALLGTLFDTSGTASSSLCLSSFFTPHPSGGFVWSTDGPLNFYKSNGNNGLDNTFGASGVTTLTLPSTFRVRGGRPLATQPDGKVIAATLFTTTPPNQDDFNSRYPLIARFNANGSLDTTFAPGGYLSISKSVWSIGISTPIERMSEVESLPDGKILVTGVSNGKLLLFRLSSFNVNSNVYFPVLATQS